MLLTNVKVKLGLFIGLLFCYFIVPAQAAALVNTSTDLYYPSVNTIAGNPSGKVTVVEFFDYRCGYCRELSPILWRLIKSNNQVRVVFRDYPLLGFPSELAATAAMAAQLQGKYIPFHLALFATPTPLSKPVIISLAQQNGLNLKRLDKDMNGFVVTQGLHENQAFAKSLSVDGIPTLFVAATPDSLSVYPVSAIMLTSPTLAQLQQAVAQVSK